jgi:hypothetical protein
MDLTLYRRPYESRFAYLEGQRIDAYFGAASHPTIMGQGLVLQFATNPVGERKSMFDASIPPGRFEALALEMIKAAPEAAVRAFSAATVKAFDAAMNPPTKENAA